MQSGFKGDTLTIPGHGFLDRSGTGSGCRHLDKSTLVVVRVVVVSIFCSIGGWSVSSESLLFGRHVDSRTTRIAGVCI